MQRHRHRRQFVLISYWIWVTIYQVTKFLNDRKHGRNLDDPMSVMPFTPQLKKLCYQLTSKGMRDSTIYN